MPFITEEIWQALVNDGSAIMVQDFPAYDEKLTFESDESAFEKIIAGIKAIRNCRGEMNVPPSKKAKLFIETQQADIFAKGVMFFERLGYASEVHISDKVDEKDWK